ncbi:MAG: hypothetical protein LQ346_007253 [Caloplaca aetnensis]|nr:MAG: hypothetical protein LQ346_007253 [Caloplaca aetnensis]
MTAAAAASYCAVCARAGVLCVPRIFTVKRSTHPPDSSPFAKGEFVKSQSLLLAQAELSSLESQLNAVDTEERVQLYLSSCAHDNNQRRLSLLKTIKTKLESYDGELFRFFQLSALHAPRERNIQSFTRWMNAFKPLIQEESAFLQINADLVSPRRNDEVGLLEESIERVVRKTGIGRRFLQTDVESQKTSDPDLHYFSTHRQVLLARVLHTIAASCLLVIPTLLLYIVESQKKKLVIIAICTIAFATTVAVFTKARRHEIFTSTAA